MAEERDDQVIETPEELAARQAREAETRDTAKGLATAGAGAAGCLGVALMPWTIIIIILIFVVIWAVIRHGH
jgi:glycerate kinase